MVIGRLPLPMELWVKSYGIAFRASSQAIRNFRPTPKVSSLSLTKIASRKIALRA